MAYETGGPPNPDNQLTGQRVDMTQQAVRPPVSAPPPMNDANQDLSQKPARDDAKMEALGIRMLGVFEQYKKDRKHVEEQWLRNLRQHRGIYDPEIEKTIRPDQSKAYPKITRQKDIGMISKLMEMLFPETEKNWACEPSEMPDVEVSSLQSILDTLQQSGEQITDEMIEAAVLKFCQQRATKMTKKMSDRLDKLDYVSLVKQVVTSAVVFSLGLAQGPFVDEAKSRTWTQDGVTGQWKAIEITKLIPVYKFVSVWDYYPDLSSKTLREMDGQFVRHIMSRQSVRDLADRPDFFADKIKGWLEQNTAGNFVEQYWERELRWKGDKQNITNISGRKYELYEWWGACTGADLMACGIKADPWEMYEACIWGLGNAIIKVMLNPLGSPAGDRKIRGFHHFIFEEDDISLLGNGLPSIQRDSQMAVCEAARMMLDNASVVCGPMLEVDAKRLNPGQDMDIYARKVWVLDPDVDLGPANQQRAINEIKVDSHITELREVMEFFMKINDQESGLPAPAMGDTTGEGKEPYRTSAGMSMLFGAAALPLRDIVRNFDKFTESFVGSLYYWFMQFDDDESCHGDFNIKAKGSTSLIAKEVRANAIDQFHATLTPEEKDYIDVEEMLKERMKARDVPLTILANEDEVQKRLDAKDQQAQTQYEWQLRTVQAQVRNVLAEAFKNIALGRKASVSADVQAVESILEVIANAISGSGSLTPQLAEGEAGGGGGEKPAGSDATQPGGPGNGGSPAGGGGEGAQ